MRAQGARPGLEACQRDSGGGGACSISGARENRTLVGRLTAGRFFAGSSLARHRGAGLFAFVAGVGRVPDDRQFLAARLPCVPVVQMRCITRNHKGGTKAITDMTAARRDRWPRRRSMRGPNSGSWPSDGGGSDAAR